MEQIEEGIAEQEEISNALAQPVGEPMDEDELEADLAELMGAGEQSAVRGEARAAKQPGQVRKRRKGEGDVSSQHQNSRPNN